uniref:TBC domain-containing protein kinase-like protein n=1 Tax=Parascaris univalens TaxID=6257 RepID=A0A915ARJ6_PARUN
MRRREKCCSTSRRLVQYGCNITHTRTHYTMLHRTTCIALLLLSHSTRCFNHIYIYI